jgi:hypothetical protein
MSPASAVRLHANGVEHSIDAEPRLLLVHALRDHLGLTGTHVGRDTSNRGACTVHLDRRAEFTTAAAAIARELIAELARRGPMRPSRHTRPSRRRAWHTPDLRRVIRASLRAGGEPVYPHWRAPTRRPARSFSSATCPAR